MLAAPNLYILFMLLAPAFHIVSIAMDKYHKHSADLEIFLPLVKGAAIIATHMHKMGLFIAFMKL